MRESKKNGILTSLFLAMTMSSTLYAADFKEHPGINKTGSIEKLERIPGGSFQWIKADGQSLGERAAARVEAILEEHTPEPLAETASQAIATILLGKRRWS